MSIDEIFNQAAADMFGVMGMEAVFNPLVGPSVACRVDIERDVDLQPESYEATVVERGITLEAMVDSVGEPKRGDSFKVGSDEYVVRKIIENDGRFVTVVVNES